MLAFAKNLPGPSNGINGRSGGDDQKEVWLHVLNEALPYGGHTAMAIRWINNDQSSRIHSVALLGQKVPVPDRLRHAVLEREGEIYTTDPDAPFSVRQNGSGAWRMRGRVLLSSILTWTML